MARTCADDKIRVTKKVCVPRKCPNGSNREIDAEDGSALRCTPKKYTRKKSTTKKPTTKKPKAKKTLTDKQITDVANITESLIKDGESETTALKKAAKKKKVKIKDVVESAQAIQSSGMSLRSRTL